MVQAKTQSAFATKRHVFLAGDKRSRRARSRSDATANECSLATRSQSADQGATTCSTTDKAPVALLVGVPSRDDACGPEWDMLLSDGHAVQGQSKFTGMAQSSGAACYNHTPHSERSHRHHYPVAHYDWLVNHCFKALTRYRRRP